LIKEGSPAIHVHNFLDASLRFDQFDKDSERADIGRSGATTDYDRQRREELHRLDESRAGSALAPEIMPSERMRSAAFQTSFP
jgi:hypothetical protein